MRYIFVVQWADLHGFPWVYHMPLHWEGFPGSSAGKECACNAGDLGLIPGSGRSTGEGIGYPFQYSWASLVAQLVKNLPARRETWVRSLSWEDLLYFGLENSMDCILHGVTKNSGTTEQVSLSLPLRNSLSYKRVENSGTVRSQIPVRLWSISHSAQMCPTLWSHGLRLTRLICPWDSPGKNSVLIAIFFSRGSFPLKDRTHVTCDSWIGRWILYH